MITSDGWRSSVLAVRVWVVKSYSGSWHGLPASQPCYLLDEKLVLQGFRCVEVHTRAFCRVQVGEVAVVTIEFEHLGLQRALEMPCQKALPGSRRPGNANEIDLSGHEQDSLAYAPVTTVTVLLIPA